MNRKNLTLATALLTGLTAFATPALADHHGKKPATTVGGGQFSPTATIVENAVQSNMHNTLVAAVKAADLVGVLSGPGPFTVFAPTDGAFAKLPAGTVETLVKPENKAALANILTYHVVAGKVTAADVLAAIKAGGGKAELTTVQGQKLTAQLNGQNVEVIDANGGRALVIKADVPSSNGVIHVTNAVSLPK
jgi:uncharacterized surface protein with fasciclin (FAS1) repeats